MEDVTKTKCYIRLKLAMKVSFMMNVVLVVALTCLYIARKATYSDLADITPNTLSQSHAEKLLDRICLSCSYLDNAGKDTLYDNVLATSGGQLCCVNDEHGFQDVLLKMLNEHPGDLIKHTASDVEETIRKLQWWRERDFSAHLYADYHDVQSGVLKWTPDDSVGTGFIRNLTLLPGRSKVRLNGAQGAGMYFIYSLVTIQEPTKLSKGVHIINKSNAELLDNTSSDLVKRFIFRNNRTTPESYVSFLCRTNILNVGDTIETSLKMSGMTSNNIGERYSNYFGMFKL